MMVAALPVDIGFHALGKILNADPIFPDGLFAPVPCGVFTHIAHGYKRINNAVLPREKFMSCIQPGMTSLFLIRCLEFFITSVIREFPFQIGNIGDRPAESERVIEYL